MRSLSRCSVVVCWSMIALVGCVGHPTSAPQDGILTSIQGKLIVNTGESKTAFNFRWRKSQPMDIVDLWGTMGSYRTRIELDRNSFSIKLPNGEQLAADDARAWVDANLGTNVPPAALVSWLMLRPIDLKRMKDPQYHLDGRLMAFSELGWSISTVESTSRPGTPLPARLRVTKHPISLDFRIRKWSFEAKADKLSGT